MITVDQLSRLLPLNRDIITLHKALSEILPEYGIDTPERVAMFLGQCAHESYQFKAMTENLNYSERGLLKVFPKYFTRKQASQYAHKPNHIANRVYANRLCNGDEKSGDGWKYRGHGFLQVTGKYNHSEFAKFINITLEAELPFIKTLEGAIRASCWFWTVRNLNDFADRLDIYGTTLKINGGQRGLEDRTTYVRKALLIINDKADVNIPSTLSKGMKGEAVFALQVALSKRGYRVSPDGNFGSGTEAAVKQLQRDSGLTQDGLVGDRTRMLL